MGYEVCDGELDLTDLGEIEGLEEARGFRLPKKLELFFVFLRVFSEEDGIMILMFWVSSREAEDFCRNTFSVRARSCGVD